MAHEVRKTEHNGPKNGGGFWGTRADAKAGSKKVRRMNDRLAADEGAGEVDGTFLAVSDRILPRAGAPLETAVVFPPREFPAVGHS